MMKAGDIVVCNHDIIGDENPRRGDRGTIMQIVPGKGGIPTMIVLEEYEGTLFNQELFELQRTNKVFRTKILPLLVRKVS